MHARRYSYLTANHLVKLRRIQSMLKDTRGTNPLWLNNNGPLRPSLRYDVKIYNVLYKY